MKGVAMILMLLGLLVTGYLVLQDLRAKQEHDSAKIQAIEKASQVGRKLQGAEEAQENRMRRILGD